MNRHIVFLVLILLHFGQITHAQTYDLKAERKATRQQLRERRQHIRDSLETVLLLEEKDRQARYDAREILVTTTFNSCSDALSYLANSLLNNGHSFAQIDKEYHTIRTDIKSAGMAAYDIFFRLYRNDDSAVLLSVTGRIHTSVSPHHGLVSSNHTSADPVTNRGMRGSALQIAWNDMETMAASIPHTTIQYIKP